jgi:AAA+ superfamily predicted ATPase
MSSSAALALARAYLARFLAASAHRRTPNAAFGPSSTEVEQTLAAEPSPIPEDPRASAAAGAFAAALRAAPEPPLSRVARVFGLSPLDVELVGLLLAPELDHELERAYTFAIDDFTRKRPDIGFLARLVGLGDAALADRVFARLDDRAPLRRHGVVTVAAGDIPTALRQVRLADRIVAFARGLDTIDELVRDTVYVAPPVPRDSVVMHGELVAQIARSLDSAAGPPRVLLAGSEGTGRALIVQALLGEQQRAVVRVDLDAIAAQDRIAERVGAALREAALRDAAAILDGAALDRDVPRVLAQAIADAADLAVPIVFTFRTSPGWLARAVPQLVEIAVPPPTFRQRVDLWQRALPPPLAAAEDLETVASRYAFTAGAIARAARRAAATARLRDPAAPRVTLDDLGEAARLMFSHRLGGMAQRIPTGFTWDDLVLPKDTLDAVREVVRFARHRPYLLEDWGFSKKLPYGRGVSAILAGPPGTGKTMVAQLLAHELGYDLYRIDLSQIVNKYIGETEKNLARIFDEAETSHAVLFFDEADSLFAKRTEVKSSNDRYANLEVNYLLQRMETYDGVTLLATNLEQGLDEAFKRRVRFSIQFEMPEEPERKRLWRSMFPPEVPLAHDIDFDTVANRFEMAGGYIKKAALRAALIAVEARRAISTADLLEAARLEYREMGRVV